MNTKIKLNVLEKVILGIAASVMFFVFCFNAMAGGSHHNDDVVNNYTTNEYINNEYITQVIRNEMNQDLDGQIALNNAIAGFDCTYTTQRWQFGAGIGFHGDTTRPAVGGCKKFGSVAAKFTWGRNHDENSGNIFFMFPLN